eukprot:3834793-Rhodomonas_salina.4
MLVPAYPHARPLVVFASLLALAGVAFRLLVPRNPGSVPSTAKQIAIASIGYGVEDCIHQYRTERSRYPECSSLVPGMA